MSSKGSMLSLLLWAVCCGVADAVLTQVRAPHLILAGLFPLTFFVSFFLVVQSFYTHHPASVIITNYKVLFITRKLVLKGVIHREHLAWIVNCFQVTSSFIPSGPFLCVLRILLPMCSLSFPFLHNGTLWISPSRGSLGLTACQPRDFGVLTSDTVFHCHSPP